MFFPSQLPQSNPMQSGGFNMAPQLAQQFMGNTMALQQQSAQTQFLPSMLQQRLRHMNIENQYLPMMLGTQAFANAGNTVANLGRDRLMDIVAPGWSQDITTSLANVLRATGLYGNAARPDLSDWTQAQQKFIGGSGNLVNQMFGRNSGAQSGGTSGGPPPGYYQTYSSKYGNIYLDPTTGHFIKAS